MAVHITASTAPSSPIPPRIRRSALHTASKKLPCIGLSRKKATSSRGEPKNGRRIHENCIPNNALPAIHAPRVERAIDGDEVYDSNNLLNLTTPLSPATAISSTWIRRYDECAIAACADSGAGTFTARKKVTGATEPRISPEIANALSKACNDCRKPKPLPNSIPNSPFNIPLQPSVSAISKGIFTATYTPINGDLQNPTVKP